MNTVCGESELSGWHAERCTELASAVPESMLDDNYENRENFNSNGLCTNFWSKFVVEEKARVEKERAEREAAEKKAAEEAADAAKKAAKEEAEKQAEEAKAKMEQAQAAAQEAAKHHREVLANNTAHSNVTATSNATVVA